MALARLTKLICTSPSLQNGHLMHMLMQRELKAPREFRQMRGFSQTIRGTFLRPRLSLDRKISWWIALACAVLGVVIPLKLVAIPVLAAYIYWIVLGGLILLLVESR